MGSVTNLVAAFAMIGILVPAVTVSANCANDDECLNGGTCSVMACTCADYFTGVNCETGDCVLDQIAFSNYTSDSVDHDASILVACNMGYSTGMGTLTELSCNNGTLSPDPLVCYGNCAVDAIAFSNQSMNGLLDHGASILVACDMGYSIGTITELSCDNGTLSETPVCYGNCAVDAIAFSNQSMNGLLDHGASILVACDMGYSIGTITELSCDNGTLSETPVCYENCAVVPIPFSNQSMNGTVDHNASIFVACDMGYSTGMGTLTELMCDNGTLSDPPVCNADEQQNTTSTTADPTSTSGSQEATADGNTTVVTSDPSSTDDSQEATADGNTTMVTSGPSSTDDSQDATADGNTTMVTSDPSSTDDSQEATADGNTTVVTSDPSSTDDSQDATADGNTTMVTSDPSSTDDSQDATGDGNTTMVTSDPSSTDDSQEATADGNTTMVTSGPSSTDDSQDATADGNTTMVTSDPSSTDDSQEATADGNTTVVTSDPSSTDDSQDATADGNTTMVTSDPSSTDDSQDATGDGNTTMVTSDPSSTDDSQEATADGNTTVVTSDPSSTDDSQETTANGSTTGDIVPETTTSRDTTTPTLTTTTQMTTTDLNECATGRHDCDINAQCINTIGSYTCECREGYEGDGFSCYERIYIAYGPGIDQTLRYYQYGFLAWYTIRLETGFPVGSGRLYNYITFTSTGMMYFSYYYPFSSRLRKYINPSVFSFSDQFRSDPAIAVFGAPVDLYRGDPKIYYQVYNTDLSRGNSASQLSALKERIYSSRSLPSGINSPQFIEGINFFFKITWHRVQPQGSVSGVETNTYQAILFTDGKRSGILNMYQEGSMRWDSSSKFIPARIGWNIKSNRYNRYRRSENPYARYQSYRPDLRIGTTGLRGRDIYRLDINSDRYINPRRYCQNWYNKEINYDNLALYADPCPCTLWQAFLDPRFVLANLAYYGYGNNYVSGLPYYYYGRTVSFQPRWPRYGGGYRCTYYSFWWWSFFVRGHRSLWISSHYQVVMPTNARFISPFYNLNDYFAWIERDVLPRFYCCQQAGGRYCNKYERLRPRATCWGYRPPRRGRFWGDPHIRSIDGMSYTFNGLGEYFLMRYTHGDPFVLQSRTGKAYNNSQPVDHGTVFTGFAATQTITTVEFQLNENRTEMSILVNGSSINMTALLEDGYDSRDATFILSTDNETESEDEIKATALFQPDGYPSTSFTVTFKNGILDISVLVPSEYAENGTGRGLLGNLNGNKSDDFLFRNGTVLTDPPDRNLTDREIFQFGQSWQITAEESLFEYGNSDWSSYNPSNYTPIFLDELLALDPDRTAAARVACGDSEPCLFDYLAVSPDMGQQTMTTGEQLDNDIEMLDNFPPNITSVTEITDTDALQDDDVLHVQVGVNVTLLIVAHDPNEADEVDFTVNSTTPDDASISADGIFMWVPSSLNVSSIEIIAMDNRNAQTSIEYKVLICHCENNGVCDFEEQAEGQDLNANGVAVVTCNCTDGWSGDHCDVDFDACEGGGPCYEGVICYDEPPSSEEEYRCGPCPPLLSGNGSNCFDFNECAENQTNDCDQNCENNLGSYTCSCNPGFILGLDQRSCKVISDCDEALMNSTGSENCTCDPGFELENGTCSDFDECAADVDECPSDVSTCNNLQGGYNCTCLPGYENSSPTECQDIDECTLDTDDCDIANNRVCMNTQGSFSCICKDNTFDVGGTCQNASTLSLGIGFSFISGFSTEFSPETIESDDNQRQLAEDVLNFINESSQLSDDELLAVSVQNYSLAGSYVLVFFRVDLKEDTPLNVSSLERIFMELLPSSRVVEPNNIVRPEDINECELSSDACSNGECTNTDGSFYCTCHDGFDLGEGNDSCIDINECLADNECNQTCVNSPGNYSCSCQPGFELDGDGASCNEINECTSDPCQNGATCNDLINMYNCTCEPSYNGINCETETFTSILRIEVTVSRLDGVDLVFTSDLEVNTSAAFQNMETTFCGAFTTFLRSNFSSAENFSCHAVSFRNGSVIGDLAITIVATSQSLANSLSDSVATLDLENASLGSLSIASVSVDRNDSCNSNPCRNGGTCTDGFNEFSCVCAEDFSGNDCSEYTGTDTGTDTTDTGTDTVTDTVTDTTATGSGGLSTGAIIGIALGSLALVLLIILIVCCVVVKKKSGPKNKSLVTGSRSRVSPLLNQSDSWQTEDQAMLAMEDRRYQGGGHSSGANNPAVADAGETKN